MKDVTIYTFMIAILSPDSEVKARNIWCAADRSKAWSDWMLEHKEPPTVAKCDEPSGKNQELAIRYHVTGTPTIYLADGFRAGAGYMPAAKIEEALNSVETRKAAAAKK
jgi:thiol:disulfide interchange protein DsbC